MRNKKLGVFYHPKMVPPDDLSANYSQSPKKPKLFMDYLIREKFDPFFELKPDFPPFGKEDFLVAHSERYVEAFFKGERPLCESNNLTWTPGFATSVTYTNASLYHAIKSSITHPNQIFLSPTSGFHHARPYGGSGFCTFSGQVIASVKLFREFGWSGAFLDMDGHFGNSIEDSRSFVADLNDAIPLDCNINPAHQHQEYLQDLQNRLSSLKEKIRSGQIQYIVHAKGADSYYLDDLGGQLYLDEWITAGKMVYSFVKEISDVLQRPFPISICLFGGYRKNNYEEVLALHLKDLKVCRQILCEPD